MRTTRRTFVSQGGMAAGGLMFAAASSGQETQRPNILWICVEDMSANMSCYGESAIQTPAIDRLADEGTLFSNAFVTCPVCSPSRTALITGMYQTSVGGHEHRSSRGKERIYLPSSLKTIPEQFRDAGYFVTNGQMIASDPAKTKRGKTDYNFEYDFGDLYDAHDWRLRPEGTPFFAQVQLRGGKYRAAKVANPVDPASVTLPPYYPDDPVLREDWAKYLNSVLQVDAEVKQILETLREDGDLDNTVVFFWTDHGISHVRDKQFLYDGGMHVPLIVRGPGIESWTLNDSLVEHLDIAVTSMQCAGIAVPDTMEGQSLLHGEPRTHVVSARDRCDETVERIRCVRTKQMKYIRNYFPERAHAQPNRYKDGKEIMKTMRRLHDESGLNAQQDRVFQHTRPREELYDLGADPHETNNLALDPEYAEVRNELRNAMDTWMKETGDLGVFPETSVVIMMSEAGSSAGILDNATNREAWDVIHAMEREALDAFPERRLAAMMQHEHSAVRAMACYELGRNGLGNGGTERLSGIMETDGDEIVRVAAAQVLARCRAGAVGDVRASLVNLMTGSENECVRHYAALGLEDLGEDARPVLDSIRKAQGDPYEYVQRVAARTVETLAPKAAP